MIELNDKEKDLLAYALFCFTAGIGNDSKRADIVDLVQKLCVPKEYSAYAYEVVREFESRFGPQKKSDANS